MVEKRTVKESLEGMEVYNKLGKVKSDSDYEGLSEGIVLCNVPSIILKSHMNPMICHEVESLIGQLANHVNVYADESGITVELEKVRNLDATTMCECYEQFESILFAPTAAILYKWDSVRKRYQSYPAQYAVKATPKRKCALPYLKTGQQTTTSRLPVLIHSPTISPKTCL